MQQPPLPVAMSLAAVMARQDSAAAFDPHNVDLEDADERDIICFLAAGKNEYDGRLGARISAIFVILIVSTAVTVFPVIATRSRRMRINKYAYLFARYFGTGVIIATAFIHLLDPSYEEIGPASCVGMTGGWSGYTWPPAIAFASGMVTFLMDFGAEHYVKRRFGGLHGRYDEETHLDAADIRYGNKVPKINHTSQTRTHNPTFPVGDPASGCTGDAGGKITHHSEESSINADDSGAIERSFQQQIAAFLVLEFGIIFHSVIIGLTLGSTGDEFPVLYAVIVFHQSFEGLGIGARLSAIPIPERYSWITWALCAAYGLTTPIAIAIGLGVRTTYNESSMTANIVSGVLDSISAGILLYTGFVELLARDFFFNPNLTRNGRQLTFMIISMLLGGGIMALLGKWA